MRCAAPLCFCSRPCARHYNCILTLPANFCPRTNSWHVFLHHCFLFHVSLPAYIICTLARVRARVCVCAQQDYQRYCAGLPDVDSPEIFGLHPNADLTYRMREATALLAALEETQPKGGGGGGGVGGGSDAAVLGEAARLLEDLPTDYQAEVFKTTIETDPKHGRGGLSVPRH